MEPTTTTPTKKEAAKKSATKQPLEQVKTGRIIMHLVYRHRVGLLITNNVALIGYLIMQAVK